jgi:NAD+ diphosphatase
MSMNFRSRVQPGPDISRAESLLFVFRGGELLVGRGSVDGAVVVPGANQLPLSVLQPRSENYLGDLDGRGCFVIEVDGAFDPPANWSFQGLRSVYGLLDDTLFAIAGRAVQIADWDRNHRFCGRCGAPTEPLANERARHCVDCGLSNFPRLSPAVIVLVERDGRALLARGHSFQTNFYSCIAGFVEPGESLENAVRREVEEETGILVKDIAYFSSQPWPFPNSLMIGFTARYESGEIEIDESEIVDAGWFSPESMPNLPGRISIARQLIDHFLSRHGVTID